ncbi:hypothetical protein NDI47_15230 [Microcoleus vaginatus GB1-A2]|uniref:hypothetical protein n=1 Tax=Microcoleus vaginatus TaxID=119532 RepID=UPI00168585A4|nr:hypothetical protein [Microcoleus sp. FACHB-61]
MNYQNLKRASGLFTNHRNAEQALVELKSRGFPMHKISVIAKPSDNDDLDSLGVQQVLITRAAGAQVGAILGSIRLGSVALIVGLSSLLIPGIGPALAVESILATFFGSGIAATAGGLYGALQGWLVPEEQARIYNDRFNQGDYLIVIEARKNEIVIAEPVLKRWEILTWRVYDAT